MHKPAQVLCLLSLVSTVAAQGYTTDFESFFASATGTPCAGQDGFYIAPVAGSIDGAIYTYAGNTLGLAANPNGGAHFWAGVSAGVVGGVGNFARSQRAVTPPVPIVHVSFDIAVNYVGTLTPTQNVGSFSFQNSATSVYVNMLARWSALTLPPTGWNADYVLGPTQAGTPTVFPDPNFLNLPLGVWHRWGVTIDLVTGVHIDFRITNGVTNVTTVYTPPAPLQLPGFGMPLPTDFRLFAGGNNAGNLVAIDNLTISWGADYTTFGAGCPGALGIPTLDAAPGTGPAFGTTLDVVVGNLPIDTAVMITGFSNTLWAGVIPLPLPLGGFGFPGCDLLVDLQVLDLIAGSGNTAHWLLAVPVLPAFAGVELFNQGASLDTGVTGFAFSNGGRMQIGY